MKNRLTAAFMAIIFSICQCACGKAPDSSEAAFIQREIFAMDTIMTVKAYGGNAQAAVDEAVSEIQRLDALLSVGSSDSEVYKINQSGGGRLSGDTLYLAGRALEIYDATSGAYDMTVYPLMKLWGFTDGTPSVPDDKSISEALSWCGSDKLLLEGDKLTLGRGQGIDMGGISKGYTSGRIMDIFVKHGVSSGIVSLGGNVQCFGAKPDGCMWRCGVTDPEAPDSESLAGVLSLRDKAVITSGGYERYFTDDSGRRYHHIMDMKTGRPADSGLLSVTIVSDDGTLADALSTACFVMGEERAYELWKSGIYDFGMILITADGKTIITEDITDSFESANDFKVMRK